MMWRAFGVGLILGDKKNSFEQSFSESENFTGDPASQQTKLLPDIIKKLTDDIFNKAFANW